MFKIKPKHRATLLIQNILLFFIASIICLIILEAFIRLFIPQNQVSYAKDPFVGWIHAPNATLEVVGLEFKNHFVTNSVGFVDGREYVYEKKRNTFRILMLGDSFAEAMQVPPEKSFAKLLDKKLNQNSSINFEILNTGISGYGTDNEYLLLKHYGLKYKPDLVIMAFFPGNDFANNYFQRDPKQMFFNLTVFDLDPRGQFYTEGNSLANRSGTEVHTKIIALLITNSQLASLLYYQVYPITSAMLNRVAYRANKLIGIGIYQKNYSEDWEEAVKLTDGLILATKNLAENNGAQFMLVSLTSNLQLDDEFLNDFVAKYNIPLNDYDFEKPDKNLLSFCEKEGIHCMALAGPFKNYTLATGHELHYFVDGHWNTEGHALAAEEIYKYLNRMGLIPANT